MPTLSRSLSFVSLMLQVPKTCENFLVLCKRSYYNGTGGWGGVGWSACMRGGSSLCCVYAKARRYHCTSQAVVRGCIALTPAAISSCDPSPQLSFHSCFVFPSFLSLPSLPSPPSPLPHPCPSPFSSCLSLQYFTDPSGISWYVGMRETHTASVLGQ